MSEDCKYDLHVTVHPEEDGWVVVECPALPGCVSQRRDESESLANIKEAITGWLWAEDQKALEAIPKDALQILPFNTRDAPSETL